MTTEDQDRTKPVPIAEIIKQDKGKKRVQGKIPLPIGVGRGIGYEQKHMGSDDDGDDHEGAVIHSNSTGRR